MWELLEKFNYMLLTSPIYWTLIIVCIIIIFVGTKYYNEIIGWFGEKLTRKELNKLDKSKYVILNDMMILVKIKHTK